MGCLPSGAPPPLGMPPPNCLKNFLISGGRLSLWPWLEAPSPSSASSAAIFTLTDTTDALTRPISGANDGAFWGRSAVETAAAYAGWVGVNALSPRTPATPRAATATEARIVLRRPCGLARPENVMGWLQIR